MRWMLGAFVVCFALSLDGRALAQAQAGSVHVSWGYELKVVDPIQPLERRHNVARGSGLAVLSGLVLGTIAFGAAVGACVDGNTACEPAFSLFSAAAGTVLISGIVFVYSTNRQSRALRRRVEVSRWRGIVAALLYALPYTQPLALIFAARQHRLNRIALRQMNDTRARFW